MAVWEIVFDLNRWSMATSIALLIGPIDPCRNAMFEATAVLVSTERIKPDAGEAQDHHRDQRDEQDDTVLAVTKAGNGRRVSHGGRVAL